jgi:hypothetical protein
MAKEKVDTETGEMFDITPENQKEILAFAKQLKKVSAKKKSLADDEKVARHELIEAVRSAGLQPMDNGVIILKINGMTITVTPKEENVKIQENGDE